MARMTWELGLGARGEAVIQLYEDGTPSAHLLLDETALSGLIDDLARLRANMAEPVPAERDPVSRAQVIRDPGWDVPRWHDAGADRRVLLLRHPGLGWTGWDFQAEAARSLAEQLVRAPSPPPRRNRVK